MKWFPVVLSCTGMALLLFFSAEAAAAAQNALLLWWRSVLPALFPFYVCADALQTSGLFSALKRHLAKPALRLGVSPAAVPCFLFGALFGFPTGARLCAREGVPQLAPLCNLCSPIFLLSVLSTLFGNQSFFFPTAIAHYASALLCAPLILRKSRKLVYKANASYEAVQKSFSLIESIGEGMLVMLRIGGCIVLFSVLSALASSAGIFSLLAAPFKLLGAREETICALLGGALEFTSGCAAVLAAGEAPRVTAALCAGLVSFGGLCVYFQARMFIEREEIKGYLPAKLAQAVLAAGMAYLLSPLFLRDATPVMEYSVETIRTNASGGAAILGASAVGISAVYLAGVIIKKARARPGRFR